MPGELAKYDMLHEAIVHKCIKQVRLSVKRKKANIVIITITYEIYLILGILLPQDWMLVHFRRSPPSSLPLPQHFVTGTNLYSWVIREVLWE